MERWGYLYCVPTLSPLPRIFLLLVPARRRDLDAIKASYRPMTAKHVAIRAMTTQKSTEPSCSDLEQELQEHPGR